MSVFVSYSHKDAPFVDRLSARLIENNVKVWKDKWKVIAGDLFLSKIRAGIEGASHFCVVLSKHSLRSKWVKEEISEALLQEAKEKGIVILPLLIDDCKVPPLLSDRVFVDFRNDFDAGLQQILSVVGNRYNLADSGRIDTDSDYFFDYGIEQKRVDGKYFLQIDVVSFDKEETFTVLSQFKFYGTEHATPEYLELEEGESLRDFVLKTCAQEFAARPARVKLNSQEAQTARFPLQTGEGVTCFDVEARVRRLGVASREMLLFNVGGLFGQICAACGLDPGRGDSPARAKGTQDQNHPAKRENGGPATDQR